MNIPELRFPEFQKAWERKKIKDILVKVGNAVDVKEGVKYREIGIRSHGKGLFYKDETDIHEIGNKRVFWIEPDCFIVNIVFAWERAVARTTQNEVGMIASHRFPMYKPDESQVDLDYLTTYFTSSRGQQVLMLASPGGAGRNKTLGQKEFADSTILLPSLAEQKKIVEFIRYLEKMITCSEAEVESLEQQKRGMMQLLFSKDIRFKKDDGIEYPEWQMICMGEITQEYNLRNKKCLPLDIYSVNNEVGFLPQSEQFEDAGYLQNTDTSVYMIVPPNYFAYNPARINVGSIGYQNTGKTVQVSSLYEVFNTSEVVDDAFLWQWFHTEYFRNMVLKLQEGGVRQYFYYDKLSITKIELPCLEEQHKIAQCLDAFDNAINLAKQELEAWKNLKQGFMQRMFV